MNGPTGAPPKPRNWRLVVVLLLSISAAAFAWSRPPAPTWESDNILGGSNPIGFTPDGLLVSLDSPYGMQDKSRLRIRDAVTGQIVQEHLLALPLQDSAEMTPDGSRIILKLESGAFHRQMLVVSRSTGKSSYPPISVEISVSSPISPDGRYKMVSVDMAPNAAEETNSIIDLTTGKLTYSTNLRLGHGFFSESKASGMAFSPDSSQWVELCRKDDQNWLLFHSLTDGREIGRCRAPEILGSRKMHLTHWTHDRLGIGAHFYPDPKNPDVVEQRAWSFHLNGTQLDEMHPDPALSGQTDFSKEDLFWSDRGDSWAAQERTEDAQPRWLLNTWNGLVGRIPGGRRFQRYSTFNYRRQAVSPQTGEPVSRAILAKCRFVTSRKGEWVASGGERLQLWSLPPRSPWGTTLLAAIVPWLLLLPGRTHAKNSGR